MAYMRHMASMELDDDEKLDFAAPIEMKRPDYPCGLRICLTEKEFEKLDLDHSEAEVGGTVHGHFIGRVTSASQETRDGETCCRVEIQIEELEIESEDEENEENEAGEEED
jgi:hypothetical protein